MVGCHVDAIIYHQFVINPFLDFPTDHTGWELGSWGAGRDAARLRAAGGDGGGSVQRLVPGAEMLQAFGPRRAGSFAGDTGGRKAQRQYRRWVLPRWSCPAALGVPVRR